MTPSMASGTTVVPDLAAPVAKDETLLVRAVTARGAPWAGGRIEVGGKAATYSLERSALQTLVDALDGAPVRACWERGRLVHPTPGVPFVKVGHVLTSRIEDDPRLGLVAVAVLELHGRRDPRAVAEFIAGRAGPSVFCPDSLVAPTPNAAGAVSVLGVYGEMRLDLTHKPTVGLRRPVVLAGLKGGDS